MIEVGFDEQDKFAILQFYPLETFRGQIEDLRQTFKGYRA
jgi:hypothetical protein